MEKNETIQQPQWQSEVSDKLVLSEFLFLGVCGFEAHLFRRDEAVRFGDSSFSDNDDGTLPYHRMMH